MLTSYTILHSSTTYNSCNLRKTLAIDTCTGRASTASVLPGRDKKRPTKWVMPPSQRGKYERRIGWKKNKSQTVCSNSWQYQLLHWITFKFFEEFAPLCDLNIHWLLLLKWEDLKLARIASKNGSRTHFCYVCFQAWTLSAFVISKKAITPYIYLAGANIKK